MSHNWSKTESWSLEMEYVLGDPLDNSSRWLTQIRWKINFEIIDHKNLAVKDLYTHSTTDGASNGAKKSAFEGVDVVNQKMQQKIAKTKNKAHFIIRVHSTPTPESLGKI